MKTIKALSIFVLFFAVVVVTGCSDSKKEEVTEKKTEKSETQTDTKTTNSATGKGEKKEVSASESKLEWIGKKVTGQHNGTVDITSGELFVENDVVTGGSFDIDFKTITVLDVEDAESNAKLTKHLKSGDFFSADTHPAGKFEITSVSKINGEQYNVTGNLTIKGISKEISFPATIKVTDGEVSASAELEIDRTLWDIQYRSGKFFENLGDKLISDNFNIKFSINTL